MHYLTANNNLKNTSLDFLELAKIFTSALWFRTDGISGVYIQFYHLAQLQLLYIDAFRSDYIAYFHEHCIL